jgi:hypothetical protein
MRSEQVSLDHSAAGVIAGGQIQGAEIRSGVVAGQEVQANHVRTGLLLASHVDGPVETLLDQRTALTLGVAFGLVSGLLSLVRALLVRRDQ